jgi:hypothetical protein
VYIAARRKLANAVVQSVQTPGQRSMKGDEFDAARLY